jgi:hypothetical protein
MSPDINAALDALGRPDAVTFDAIKAAADGTTREWLTDNRHRRHVRRAIADCGYWMVGNPWRTDRYWHVNGRRQAVYARAELLLRDQLAAARRMQWARQERIGT